MDKTTFENTYQMFVYAKSTLVDLGNGEEGFFSFFDTYNSCLRHSMMRCFSPKLVLPALGALGELLSYDPACKRLVVGAEMREYWDEFKRIVEGGKGKEFWGGSIRGGFDIAGPVNIGDLAYDVYWAFRHKLESLPESQVKPFTEAYRTLESIMVNLKPSDDELLLFCAVCEEWSGRGAGEITSDPVWRGEFDNSVAKRGITLPQSVVPSLPECAAIVALSIEPTRKHIKRLSGKLGIWEKHGQYLERMIDNDTFQSIRCYCVSNGGLDGYYFLQIPKPNTIVNLGEYGLVMYRKDDLPDSMDELIKAATTKSCKSA